MDYQVAIIGRPNVGKSTLFNRLVGKRLALVHDQPGMTRDRREGKACLYDLEFTVIDTAGLADPDDSTLTKSMLQQTMVAVEQSDVILFVVDGREGCTTYDRDLANILRRQKKPIVVIANKCEGTHGNLGRADAVGLGQQPRCNHDPLANGKSAGRGMRPQFCDDTGHFATAYVWHGDADAQAPSHP